MIRRQPIASPPTGSGGGKDLVSSVNGQIGDVVLSSSDVGVDAQQVADMAADMVTGELAPGVDAAKGDAGAAKTQAGAASAAADQAANAAADAAAMAANSRTMTVNHRNNRDNPHDVTPEQLGLHPVATSGSYLDLVDAPTIPTVPVIPPIPSSPQDIGAQPVGDYATTSALQQVAAQVTAQVTALSGTVSAIAGRKVRLARARVALPALAIGLAKDVPVTWTPTLAEVPTAPVVLLEQVTGVSIGQVTAVVKAGSVTVSGCTVTLTAPLVVTAGAGYLTVIAAGWS